MLSASRFNRRFHQIPPELIDSLFEKIGQRFHAKNESQEYIIDRVPIPACRNTRIPRCRRYFLALRILFSKTLTSNLGYVSTITS